MRVLHLTAGSDAGGLSRYIHELCGAMHAAGHQVAVAGQRGAWHDLFAGAPWPWVDLPLKGGPLALWRAVGMLRQHLLEHPVDLLHVHYRRPMLVARRAASPLKIPILYTLHLTDVPMGFPWNVLSDFGDHTHAPSRYAEHWLIHKAGVPDHRISVIPHGIDPARFPVPDKGQREAARLKLGLHPKALVAGFVGRFDRPKNEQWVVDVARAALDDPYLVKRLQVVMVGGGPHKDRLLRRIDHLRLERRVFVLDYIDPLPVYHACDVLLLPSSREGFSLVCAEAMSAGCPVLRTRTAGTVEMIVEGVTGRSVPIHHRAFVAGALRILSNRLTLRRMGQAAGEYVRQHLTFERQFDATVSLYRRMVNSATPASPAPTPPAENERAAD